MEKAMAPHSSTFVWRVPWMGEPGGLQSMGSLESGTTGRLHFRFSLSCTGEGNGNPLQCSCLGNPRDGEAWWAAVYGIAQSWTQLKRLSSSSSSSKSLWKWSVGKMHYKHLDVLLYYCWLLFVDYDDWIYNDISPGERMHLLVEVKIKIGRKYQSNPLINV